MSKRQLIAKVTKLEQYICKITTFMYNSVNVYGLFRGTFDYKFGNLRKIQ